MINGIVSSKTYNKRNLKIDNCPFLYGDVLRSPTNVVYILHLIRFARYILVLVTPTTETNL